MRKQFASNLYVDELGIFDGVYLRHLWDVRHHKVRCFIRTSDALKSQISTTFFIQTFFFFSIF